MDNFSPFSSKNLMPLSSNELCEALITTPACPLKVDTRYEIAGVGIGPTNLTFTPDEIIPA